MNTTYRLIMVLEKLAIIGLSPVLAILGWALLENRKMRKEAAENLVSTTERSLEKDIDHLKTGIDAIAAKIDKQDEKIDNLVSKDALETRISLLKTELRNEIEKEKLILDGKILKAEEAYRHATAESRGIKRRVELLLGKIIEKFPELKEVKVKNEK
jgi:peptidoglycan hydrolase CwlO-like protein